MLSRFLLAFRSIVVFLCSFLTAARACVFCGRVGASHNLSLKAPKVSENIDVKCLCMPLLLSLGVCLDNDDYDELVGFFVFPFFPPTSYSFGVVCFADFFLIDEIKLPLYLTKKTHTKGPTYGPTTRR
uniref:Secreted protein n=1 Tax=Ixodes ricinus TaxID=34613 RepID=V5IC15_IXORI